MDTDLRKKQKMNLMNYTVFEKTVEKKQWKIWENIFKLDIKLVTTE